MAIDWRRVVKAWLHGLPRRIATLCVQVKETRAHICVRFPYTITTSVVIDQYALLQETSAEARMQLMQQGANSTHELPFSSAFSTGIRTVLRYIAVLGSSDAVA